VQEIIIMVTIMTGDCREVLKTLPDASVNCCVTSPPYWGLRDYGVGGQIGLERTPDDYVAGLVAVFREVWRILRDDGTLWLNLGDSYASGKGTCFNPGGNTSSFNVHLKAANVHPLDRGNKSTLAANGLKPKDLVGIPWRVAFALQADGWYLRSEIIWAKKNCMPESVKDRPTKAHEQIYLLAKSANYYYDAPAIFEPVAESTASDKRVLNDAYECGRPERGYPGEASKGAGMLKRKSWRGSKFHDGKNAEVHPNVGKNRDAGGVRIHGNLPGRDDGGAACNMPGQEMRNKRDVWFIGSQPYSDAHFATFPPKLITPCILAGCPEGGTVLDPFGGSGTVGEVAEVHGRNSILIEVKPAYVEMAKRRTAQQGLFCK